MSEPFWFRHDIDAAEGRRFTMLRLRGGYEAHGIYWALMKYLYKSGNCYPFATTDDKQVLASCLHLELTDLEQAIQRCIECDLLENIDGNLSSKKVASELSEQNVLSKKRSKAGSLGGKVSASKRQANAKQMPSKAQANLKQNQAQTVQNSTDNTNKQKKNALTSADFIFPELLNRIECKAAIDGWIGYRKELKKPTTKSSIEQIIKKYRERPNELVRDIKHSVMNGWQGIYAPKTDPPKPQFNQSKQPLNGNELNTLQKLGLAK